MASASLGNVATSAPAARSTTWRPYSSHSPLASMNAGGCGARTVDAAAGHGVDRRGRHQPGQRDFGVGHRVAGVGRQPIEQQLRALRAHHVAIVEPHQRVLPRRVVGAGHQVDAAAGQAHDAVAEPQVVGDLHLRVDLERRAEQHADPRAEAAWPGDQLARSAAGHHPRRARERRHHQRRAVGADHHLTVERNLAGGRDRQRGADALDRLGAGVEIDRRGGAALERPPAIAARRGLGRDAVLDDGPAGGRQRYRADVLPGGHAPRRLPGLQHHQVGTGAEHHPLPVARDRRGQRPGHRARGPRPRVDVDQPFAGGRDDIARPGGDDPVEPDPGAAADDQPRPRRLALAQRDPAAVGRVADQRRRPRDPERAVGAVGRQRRGVTDQRQRRRGVGRDRGAARRPILHGRLAAGGRHHDRERRQRAGHGASYRVSRGHASRRRGRRSICTSASAAVVAAGSGASSGSITSSNVPLSNGRPSAASAGTSRSRWPRLASVRAR